MDVEVSVDTRPSTRLDLVQTTADQRRIGHQAVDPGQYLEELDEGANSARKHGARHRPHRSPHGARGL